VAEARGDRPRRRPALGRRLTIAPSFHIGILPDRPVEEVVALCRDAEEHGFDGYWIADSQSVFRDAFAALAVAATQTKRIKLATGVTNPLTRHPAVLAHSFATLDELSGGRAIIGIGVGDSAVHTLGLRPATLAQLEQTAIALRALTAGESVDWNGSEIKVAWSRRALPLYFASSGPKSLRLAGRLADGVLFQVGSEPSFVRYALRAIAEGEREAGRPAGDAVRLVRLACAVADGDRARAEIRGYATVAAKTALGHIPREDVPADLIDDLEAMKEQYDYYGHGSTSAPQAQVLTERVVDSVTVAGTPDEVAARLRGLIALGVDGFVMPAMTKEPRAFMRLFAERVIPQL
jgi:5,10-methylenetetrahydromethanopterin reductase